MSKKETNSIKTRSKTSPKSGINKTVKRAATETPKESQDELDLSSPIETKAQIPYGKMSSFPENKLDKNWSREEVETPDTTEIKLNKIISLLRDINSELVTFNNPQNIVTLESETKDENSLEDMSWNVLDYLHKQAADTLNRLNFHPQNIGEEFNFAKKRFNKLNEILINKLKQINWD